MVAPLTPPESDLQDFPFMPLHVARLRDSDLAAEEKPEACWYAVLLWAASWHQLPAGSLPDNDAILARLIGLGRDLRTFRRHKAAAMRGFAICDDGRLYHPVVAEQVIAAWNSKLQQRWRTECARVKKANQRNGTELPQPTFEEFLSTENHGPGPAIVPEDEADCPPGQRLQETGTGTGTGTERLKEPPKPPEGAFDVIGEDFERAWRAYPDTTTGSRDQALAAFEAELPRAGGCAPLAKAVEAFAAHQAKVGAKAKTPPAFHVWLARRRYDTFLGAAGGQTAAHRWTGPPDIWTLIAAARSPEFANSWLGASTWQAEPPTVISPALAFRRLRDEVGPVLADKGIGLTERAA